MKRYLNYSTTKFHNHVCLLWSGFHFSDVPKRLAVSWNIYGQWIEIHTVLAQGANSPRHATYRDLGHFIFFIRTKINANGVAVKIIVLEFNFQSIAKERGAAWQRLYCLAVTASQSVKLAAFTDRSLEVVRPLFALKSLDYFLEGSIVTTKNMPCVGTVNKSAIKAQRLVLHEFTYRVLYVFGFADHHRRTRGDWIWSRIAMQIAYEQQLPSSGPYSIRLSTGWYCQSPCMSLA